MHTKAQERIAYAQQNKLRTLDLSNCGLTTIPEQVFSLTQLTELKLGHWASFGKKNCNQISDIPPAISKLQQLKQLDLSSNLLSDLPSEISSLANLELLDLSRNKLSSLPDNIGNLLNLRLFDASYNQLSSLPESFANLQQLNRLGLNNNNLSELPSNFGKLYTLQRLDLGNNFFTELPSAISSLSNLLQLNLANNTIAHVSNSIGNLQALSRLYLNNNQLTQVPVALTQLSKLKRLYLSHNKLSELPETINELVSLQLLDVRNNELRILPAGVVNLAKLEYLDIRSNRLRTLPDNINALQNLQLLDVRDNFIRTLSDEIARLSNLQDLYLDENPIETPPPEIASRGLTAIRNYFKELNRAREKDYLYEIKLLLVGEGRVGKTSLSKSLTIPNYSLEDEQSTEGIDVLQWIIPKEELGLTKDFRVNLWDFGGQEIYHATHQFFLTKRSVYVLVTESRKEDKHEDFFYWLNIIRLLGANSPVVMVLNKCDQPTKELPIKEYQKTFGNIVAFSKISCLPEYRATINTLKNKIKQIIMNRDLLPHLGTPLPKVWVDIRSKLEQLKYEGYDYISYKRYLDICKKHYQDESNALFLSEFFHDLGVLLHFKDDVDLREMIFLNQDWVTTGVYKVLDNQRVKNKRGNFTDDDLQYIWQDSQYIDRRKELLALMKNEKFELCFELRPGQYLAPQLLPVDEISYNWNNSAQELRYEYRYQFMPKGILTRFIVKQNKYIHNSVNWRYGVLIAKNDTRALVKEEYFSKRINIKIEGENKPELLQQIIKTLDEINESFNNIEVEEMYPCQCQSCKTSENPHFYRKMLLKRYVVAGKPRIVCDKSLDSVYVREIMTTVEGIDAMAHEIVHADLPQIEELPTTGGALGSDSGDVSNTDATAEESTTKQEAVNGADDTSAPTQAAAANATKNKKSKIILRAIIYPILVLLLIGVAFMVFNGKVDWYALPVSAVIVVVSLVLTEGT